MFKKLICLTSGHGVNRQRVWHDGKNYRTKCTQCAQPLIRDQGNWRRFDAIRDADESRRPHPHTGETA